MKRTMHSLKFFQPTVAATLAIVIACVISVRSAQAVPYVVTLQQVGSDVVATGSGAIDLTGLTFIGNSAISASIQPNIAFLSVASGNIAAYGGYSGPTSFGPGIGGFASSSSGDAVLLDNLFELGLPNGYVSGTLLSDSSTYNNATFASLGVTPGTYEWTWGTGANQNFTLQIGAAAGVPDSGSTFGLLLLAVATFFGVSRFRSLRLA